MEHLTCFLLLLGTINNMAETETGSPQVIVDKTTDAKASNRLRVNATFEDIKFLTGTLMRTIPALSAFIKTLSPICLCADAQSSGVGSR